MARRGNTAATADAHVGLFTGYSPAGHYSEGLAHAVWDLGQPPLTVLAGRQESLPIHPRVSAAWRPGWPFLADGLKAVKAHGIDLVHIQHEFTMFGGGASVPQVRRLAGRLRAQRIPVVTTIHAVPAQRTIDRNFVRAFTGSNRMPAAIVRLLIVWTMRGLCRESTRVVAHTRGLGQVLVRDYGLDPARLVHIPLGVPVRVPAPEPAPEPSGPLLVCPGYVSRRKGLETVVRGFGHLRHRVPGARLRLVGGLAHPAYAQELRDLAATVGAVDAITFTGMVTLPQFYGELHQADVVVLGAEYSISASQPLAQAWAAGAAVVAPATGAIDELVNDGVDGRLYPATDAEALGAAIAELIESPEERAKLAAGSRGRAARDSWTNAARRTVDLYQEVMAETRGRDSTKPA